MAAMNDRTVTVFGGTGFSVAGSFGISGKTGLPFGLHQGVRIGVIGCSVLTIRNFNRSGATFTMSVREPMRLSEPTVW
jgi:hypothetical protein